MEFRRNIHIITSTVIICILAASLDLANSYEVANDHDAMMYLNRFGYVDDETMTDNMSMSRIKPMLMEFQKMCNINRTGQLDEKTVEMMNAPRCGNLDMDVNRTDHHTMFMQDLEGGVDEGMLRRYRRFAINDNKLKWKKPELTYRMAMFSTKMGSHVNEKQVLQEVHKAFKLWSEVTNLDFFYTPKRKEVDIELSFTTRFHIQDQYPFDGPGKTLAHAFPPGEGVLGDVHFEDEEEWTIGSPKGINVLFVAVHEIGHALGLSHSMVKGAIMQPFYGGYSPKLKLHKDDIEGVQSLYGKRETRTSAFKPKEREPTIHRDAVATTTTKRPTTSRTQTPTKRPNAPPPTTETYRPQMEHLRPDLCQDSSIDAITTLSDGSVYAFKGKYAFKIHPKGKGVAPGWPHRIEAIFKGLDADLDAVVTRKNGKTYFFKGQYYWRFHGTQMDPGYPKRISIHFKGVPDNVDSAFEWLGAIYFTKGNKIWRFDPSSRPFVSDKFPILLSVWNLGRDVNKIDASFTAPNGNIYFFSGQAYWRFDEKKFKVNDDLQPAYPRSSKVMWFGCTGGAPVDYREIRQSDFEYQDDSSSFSYLPVIQNYFEYPEY